MQLDQKSILAACGIILREHRNEQRKINDELRDQIAALQRRLEALEREAAVPRLRAVGGE
jgi:hypothetical protein